MKKILFSQTQNVEHFVANGRPMGGSAVQTVVWMRALHSLQYQVYQFREPDDQREVKGEFSWVIFVPIFDPRKGARWLRWVTYRFPTVYKRIKSVKPDFYYESIPSWASYFSILICKLLGVKTILRVANDNMMDDRIYLTHSKFERNFIYRSFAIADFILPQNEYQYGRLTSMVPKYKIRKFHNPFVLVEGFLSPKWHRSSYIAWVANFRYQKNLNLLYQIASAMPHTVFKVAGQALPNLDDETSVCLEKLDFLKNVEFVGTVARENILDFFSNAAFLLNTSRYEGFSNTFLEAMATGTPILTTAAVDPDQIIQDFDLGFIYGSPSDLKNYLENLTDEQYRKLSENCINYVKKYHGHLEIGKNLVDYIEGR